VRYDPDPAMKQCYLDMQALTCELLLQIPQARVAMSRLADLVDPDDQLRGPTTFEESVSIEYFHLSAETYSCIAGAPRVQRSPTGAKADGPNVR
jgi:hypothetical protein